jgi:hypothetical protein
MASRSTRTTSRRRCGGWALALLAALAGCGGEGEGEPAAPAEPRGGPIPLAALPTSLARLCEQAQTGACPRLFPRRPGRTGEVEIQALAPPRYEGYLLDLHAPGFGGDDVGHVILGAQPDPLELEGHVGRPWPERGTKGPDAALKLTRLVVERRVAVGDAAGLVLRAAPYPRGGIHGGHAVVLWNLDGHGQLVSLHFTSRRDPKRYPHRARVATALAMARSAR